MSRQLPALGEPPDDLSGFPHWDLTTDRRVYRAHGTANGPVWFSSLPESGETNDVGGRFDLKRPMGTCYLAASPGVAVRERWGANASGRGVSQALAENTVVTEFRVTQGRRLADACSAKAAKFGAHRELGTVVPYALPQRWAAVFHDMLGRDGIRYWSRFSSGARDWAFALFAAHGADFPATMQPFVEHGRKSGTEAARSAGIPVLDTPRRVTIMSPPNR